VRGVELDLDWQGNLKGYKVHEDGFPTKWVPNDASNSDCIRIREEIESHKLSTLPPQFAYAKRTYSEAGVHTGYDTNVGFVPLESGNALYVYLMNSLNSGECTEVADPKIEQIGESEYVSDLIVLVLFDQPWAHLAGPYHGQLPITFNRNAAPEPFSFTIRNISDPSGKNPLQLSLGLHGIGSLDGLVQPAVPVGGALEIEIPARRLRKILRGVLADSTDPSYEFLRDQLNIELVRSGRKVADGPSTAWHVGMANNYLQPFLADFSNRVIEAFWQEYGGIPIAHVSPLSLQRRFTIIHKLQSGQKRLGLYASFGGHSFNLQGEWRLSGALESVADGTTSTLHPMRRSLSRLRMLMEGGFIMEALVLMNSILEVSVSAALETAANDSEDVLFRVKTLGHRMRLQLLEDLTKQDRSQHLGGAYDAFINAALGIYDCRNAYVHELVMPDKERFLDYREQRRVIELMSPFSELFRQDQWFRWLHAVSCGGGEVHNAIADFCRKHPITTRDTEPLTQA
jgi:hypothetical protein